MMFESLEVMDSDWEFLLLKCDNFHYKISEGTTRYLTGKVETRLKVES